MFKVLLSGCCGKMGTVISNLVNEFPNLEIVAGIDKFPKEMGYKVFTTPDDVNIEYDYLRRLYNYLIGNLEEIDIEQLHTQGFTVREIEKLKGESKSTVSRKLSKEEEINE